MAKILAKIVKSEAFVGSAHSAEIIVAKDIDTADEVPSCSKGTLVDVKTLSPGDVYSDDRTGESNAAVNACQVRVN